ncbi:MAG: MarR family transcriptional regulator [Hymenobacter sp.]|nr:MAG: MarR family transcriptional regulator [Hymenobacter sp.]
MSASTSPDQLAADLRTVVARLVKKLRTHSPTRSTLSLTERAVLKLLEQQPHRLPSELAELEKVTTQAMSQILRHLLALGYITRQPDATDKRKVLIALAAAGQEFLQTARQAREEWLSQALRQHCSPAELALLRQALPVLTKLVDA